MIQQLYNYADLNGGRLKVPVFFILDEFANIGRIPDFDKKISTSRSRGIQFSVILQNLDQLEAVYEKSYETIMGNCDTHVFLGSNSYKTVEYFSKALGEKTISRDSKSKNTDKDKNTTGFGESEQIMGRALMTPDELRRMDNDLCIIFEKGIKPVKAKKYYYFTHKKMLKELQENQLNHNQFDAGVRGVWRKYNPYNPYVSDNEKDISKDLKVESLDDLFEDSEKTEESTIKETIPNLETNNIEQSKINELDFNNFESTVLPQEENIEAKPKTITKPFADVDLQKELEAKFDELFGPME
jgi:type IV secretory pathway TraG/TraD family ATPase VirD4